MNWLRSTNKRLTLNYKPKVLSRFPSLQVHSPSINNKGLLQKKGTLSKNQTKSLQKLSQDNNLPTLPLIQLTNTVIISCSSAMSMV
ncbi:unnamed protein product [Prunus armeniaca]